MTGREPADIPADAGTAGRLWRHREVALFVVSTVLLLAGVPAMVWHAGRIAMAMWVAATLAGLLYSTGSLLAALRRRQPSVDVIAWLALVGTLLVGAAFAGAVIAVMLASGVLLEARAAARARRELSLLVSRAPRIARRHTAHGVVEVPIGEVAPGDRLLVGSGEIVPVDGRLLGPAVLDESALTGEPLPVERRPGEDVRSGVVNAGPPADLLATAPAAQSTYAAVVRLVEQAQAGTAPFVRAADRFAVAFVPLTLLLAAGVWALTGQAVRAVAVLVVATPCPLLLAAPIAIMSGLSRAAHVLAGPIVTAARDRGLTLLPPDRVHERHGYGVEGTLDGHRVRLGKAAWIVTGPAPAWVRHTHRRAVLDGSLTVFASVDGVPAGALLLEDPVRPDAPRMIRALRAAGVTRVVLVTGDRADPAETVGRIVGVDAVHAERDPADKLAIVRAEQARAPTVMAGDGINDALADAILIARRARRVALRAVAVGMGLSLAAMVAAAAGQLPPAAGALLQELIDVAA